MMNHNEGIITQHLVERFPETKMHPFITYPDPMPPVVLQQCWVMWRGFRSSDPWEPTGDHTTLCPFGTN